MQAQRSLDYAVYALVRVLICAIQALPLSTCELLARRFVWLCWHVIRLRRQVVEENLAIAFPEKSPAEREQIALGMWRHLFLMVMEIAHSSTLVDQCGDADPAQGRDILRALERIWSDYVRYGSN